MAKKALELLFDNIDSIEHLDLINHSIEDYNWEFKCDLEEYQEKVDRLREDYWAIEEERVYRMAVKNF